MDSELILNQPPTTRSPAGAPVLNPHGFKAARARAGEPFRRLKKAVRRAIGSAKSLGGRRQRKLGRAFSDAEIGRHWEWIITSLLHFGGASSGNSVRLFCDGDEILESLWQAIDEARQHVWVEMYTIQPDRVGKRTLDRLAAAAARGCDVKLLVDAVGSSALSDDMLQPIRDAGGHVEFFNPIWPWMRKNALLRRDHRKIVIVDGKTGFCGGMNLSEEYAGKKYGVARFQDCHMQIQGPCIRDLAAVFGQSWRTRTDEAVTLPARNAPTGQNFLQVQASSGRKGRRAIQRALRLTTRHAVRRCYVTTPYFVPPLRLIRALNHAAQRGVDVRVLTAGICDVPIVALAARHIYGRLLHKGVRIYELFDTTLHAKTITVDGLYSTVGSFNLDAWSYHRNLEVNVAIIDPDLAREMERQFLANIDRATEVTLDNWTKRSWFKRSVHCIAYQLLRI